MSGSAAAERSVSGGTQTSPSITFTIASRNVSTPNRLGMNPEAPKSSDRRMVPTSSLADTITTGIAGYCARR